MRLTALAALATCAVLTASIPPGAHAQNSLQAPLAHEMGIAGSASGAYVYDLTKSTTLFSERSEVPHPPASVEKLYTAATALELMGPEATLATSVLGAGHLGANGRWEGSLYLKGGGDPTFGSPSYVAARYGGQGATVTKLAVLVKAAGIREVTGNVDGDESWFDSLRGDPYSDYAPDSELEGELSGLSFNRGQTGSQSGAHAQAAYAALQLRGALRAEGIKVHSGTAATTPPGASTIASEASPSLATLLGLTLPPSDNYFAETLIKDIGARFGGAGTTAAGAGVVRATISKDFGLHPYLIDGSGLSHSDHTTPKQVVELLTALAHSPTGHDFAQRPGCRGRERDALRTDAPHARHRALQGKDGNLERRLQPGRLLRKRRRGHPCVRLLRRRHRNIRGAHDPRQHGDHLGPLLTLWDLAWAPARDRYEQQSQPPTAR